MLSHGSLQSHSEDEGMNFCCSNDKIMHDITKSLTSRKRRLISNQTLERIILKGLKAKLSNSNPFLWQLAQVQVIIGNQVNDWLCFVHVVVLLWWPVSVKKDCHALLSFDIPWWILFITVGLFLMLLTELCYSQCWYRK